MKKTTIKPYIFLWMVMALAFTTNLQGQYSVASPIVINSFPHTETKVNTSDGTTAIGMQGSCPSLVCCSVYVYKVTLPDDGSLRVEFNNYTPLSTSIIAYTANVANPTNFGDLTYLSGEPGNFCGFRDSLEIGSGYSWASSNPQYHDLSKFAPAGDYYVLAFTGNQQVGYGISDSLDITFKFAPTMASELICYNGIPDTLKSTAAPSGGSGNFVYEWQTSADGSTNWSAAPGDNDSVIYIPTTSLTDTTYFRRQVTDTSCSAVAYSNVKGIFVLDSVSIAGTPTAATCGATDGALDITVSGGQSPYTFTWSNAATTEDISSLSAGTYSVTITDNLGCTNSKTFVVPGASSVIISAVVDSNVTCNGNADGGVSASASGGTTPYTYAWSNAATTASITGVGAGTYTVTIIDANGCTSSTSATVTQPTTLVAASVVDSNTTCNGASDGGATASATGGTMPYTYAWSNAATTASNTGVSAGTYSVTITDANGCTSSTSATITEPVVLMTSSVVDNNVSCNGNSDGGATASATGGTMPYTYAWSNAATTASISGVTAGTYTATITDANGCTSTSSATITEPSPVIVPNVHQGDTIYQCDSSGVVASVDSISGYKYEWFIPGEPGWEQIGDKVSGYTPKVEELGDTLYLAVREGSYIKTYKYVDTSWVLIEALGNGINTANFSFVSNQGELYIAFSNSSGTQETVVKKYNSSTGSWDNVGNAVYQNYANYNIDLAFGGSNDTYIAIQPHLGPAPGYKFYSSFVFKYNSGTNQWDKLNLETENTAHSPDILVFNNELYLSYTRDNSAGTVVIKDNGIQGVTVGDTIDKSIQHTKLFEYNGELYLGGRELSNDSLLIYKFDGSDWQKTSFSGTFVDGYTFIEVFNNEIHLLGKNGTYNGEYITSGDGNNWTMATSNNDVSSGSSYQPSMSIRSGVHYTGHYVYESGFYGVVSKYSEGGLDKIAEGDTVSLVDSGLYVVRGTSPDGCVAFDTVHVIETIIDLSVSIDNHVSCNGQSDGGITATVNGGSSPYTYAWSNAATTASITGVAAGTYSVTITDANGCTSSASATVTEPTTLVVASVVDNNTTCNGASNGGATASASGGTMPYYYTWSNGATTASFTGVTAGTYTVTITDANGCTSTSSASITEPATLVASSLVDSNITCNGNYDGGATASATGGSAPYNYLWSNAATTSSITGVAAGTYTVTISDANGCTSTSSATVTEPTILVASAILDSNETCTGASNGGVSTSATGGTMPYNYMWSNGATTASVQGITSGTYTVTITDANGCSAQASKTVAMLDGVAPQILVNSPISAYLNNSGTLSLAAQDVDNGSFDNCTIDSIWLGQTEFYCKDIDTAQTTFYAVDLSGNIDSVAIMVIAVDTIKPIITVPSDTTLYANSDFCGTVLDYSVSAADQCLGGFTEDFETGAIGWTNGSLGGVNGWVLQNQTGTGTPLPSLMYGVPHSGNGSTENSYLQSPAFSSAGGAEVSFDYYCNNEGPSKGGSMYSSFVDQEIIQISFDGGGTWSQIGGNQLFNHPTEIQDTSFTISSADGTANTVLRFVYNTGDGCCGPQDGFFVDNIKTFNLPIIQDTGVASGDTLPLGVTLNKFTVTDISGNSVTDSFKVTVLDTSFYSIQVNNLTVYLDTSGQASITIADVDNGSADPCGVDTLYLSQYDFDCSNVGVNNITFTAKDMNGNMKNAISTITVFDTISPVINIGSTILPDTVPLPLDANGIAGFYTPATQFVGLNIVEDGCGIDTAFFTPDTLDCSTIGYNPITITATDINGNTATDVFYIFVEDVTAPAVVAQNHTVYLNASGNASITTADIDNGTTDACGVSSLALSQYNFDCSHVGDVATYLIATDVNGNKDSSQIYVTVIDTIKPVLATKNVTAYLDASGNASINATFIDNGTADVCGLDTLILSQYNFDCSHIGANTVTFTATDVNNNSDSITATVTVVDTIKPVVSTQNISVYLDASGQASIVDADIDNGSADACGLHYTSLSQYNFDCSHVGGNTVTLMVMDNNGNKDSATATVTVIDSIKPVVLTQNTTIYLNNAGQASIADLDIENGSTDACGIASSALSQYNFDCTHTGANTIYLSITDVNGNIDSAAAMVTVLDTINPVANVKSITAYLDASGVATVTAADVDNGSSDNCTFTLSLSQTTFDCTETGLNLKTFTITDASGNKDYKDAWITIKDTISPSLHLKNTLTVSLDQFGNASISAAQLDSASADNCSNLLFYTVNKTSFGCAELGANTVTVTAYDNKNNSTSGTATVMVMDYMAPVVSTQNITAYLDASGVVTVAANAVNNGTTDNCTIDSLWLDKSSFVCTDLGQNIVKLYAKDQSGNTAQGNAVITVADTISPVVAAQNMTVYLDANGAATINTTDVDAGSADNCTLQTLGLSKTAFDCSNVGANTVTLTAVDGSANSTTATVTVTVMDTVSPSVLTQNLTVSLDANGTATIAVSDIDNGSSDNCGIQLSSLDIISFDCTDLGANTVTLTVTDNNGNSKAATATVTVEDNTDPTVVTQDITVYLDASGSASISTIDIDNGSTDNCAIQTLSLDVTAFDCSDLGANTVTLTGVDGSSNSALATATVTVVDTISPVVSAQNFTVYLDANGGATISTADVDAGSVDNCALQALSLSKTAFDCSNVGANTVTFTAVDGSANSTTATAIVTVMDTISPSVVTQNITVSLDAAGSATIVASDIDNGSSDACGIQSMTLDVSSFTCTELGANTVTLTVTDNNSNVSVKTATVTVVDNVTPVVATQNITIYLDASGNAAITPSDVNNGSQDNCGITTYSLDISTFDCADLGQNLVILSATDASNNTGTKSAFVTVLDTIDPAITNLPATITAYAPANQCAANVQWPAIIGSDNCGVSMVNTSKANGALFQLGTTVVNVTVTDASSNTISQSFNVVVVDTVAPSVSNVPANYTVIPNANSCDAVVNWIEPVAIDNCGGVTWTKSHIPGATFPVGNTTVTYTATDSDNNATTVSFVVTITDQVAPVVSGVPANITVSADAGSCDATVSYTMPAVSDNCSGATISSTHASGSVFPIGTTTVTFTATDAASNVTTASFTVTVEDNQKPVVSSMPANDTVGSCGATYTYAMPVATDNCSSVSVVQTSGLPSGSIFPTGITVNTFKISDANGNDTVVSFTLVVVPQGMPNLPSLLEICENMPAVELSFGQNMVWSGKGIIAAGTQFDPATAGAGRHQLSYVFTDGMGCNVSGSISVTVLPQPIKPVVSRIGSTTLSTGNYNTYQWYRDGVLIPGATNQNYAYNQGGNYQVMVTNNSGCENYSDGMVVGQAGGGIGIEENLFGDLDLYPNPSNGVVTIDINRNELEELSLVIFNTAGKMVYELTEQTSYEGKLSIDLSHLPDATYMLRITSGGEVAVKRVVIY